MERESGLVSLCMEEACKSWEAIERWRRQRRSLEHLEQLPPHLADSLLRRLLRRRLLFPSLLEVFKHCVENLDLRGESSIDAEWMAYIGAFVNLFSLNLSDCHRIHSSTLWPLTGLASLKELDLSRCSKVTDSGIKHLLSLPNLEKLWISQTGVTEAGVSLLASLKNLSLLDLGGLPVTDNNLNSVQALTKLEHLDIWGSSVTNKGAALIQNFPNLTFLDLSWTNVTHVPNTRSLECLHMSKCTIVSISKTHSSTLASLRKLVLSGATFKTDPEALFFNNKSSLSFLDVSNTSLQNFGFLESMTKLEHLDLSCTAFSDDSVEFLACICENLRSLNLGNTRISTDGIGILAGCVPHLETLSLNETSIDDHAVLFISATMPSIKTLDLSKTSIRGFIKQQGPEAEAELSLAALHTLTSLEALKLESAYLKEVALLSPLQTLSGLTHLSIRTLSLTDTTFHQLSSLPNLVSLEILDSVLTNHGLENFKPQPSLRALNLKGCWLLSEECISVFCKKYPHLKVRHDFSRVSSPDLMPLPRSSPSKIPATSYRKRNPLLSSSGGFLDQRVKYGREELLALQDSPLSLPPPPRDEGLIGVPEILAEGDAFGL
ncbi:PREDICTED: toll-like receptor 13 [Tarenaya hassleriana]|uniref:toll-like receptor 13 n=1 Tax=Tarenaya hassleriana TaxID=28532 RepID=UPI00053C0C89|nr:PREDICTED: toll-like receptor 13 [Tarenaya hassleriana]